MLALNYSNLMNRAHPLNQGLVAWYLALPQWRGNTVRNLALPYHGTLTNGAAWQGSRGRKNAFGSLNFDGINDYVDLNAHVARFNLATTDILISFWFKGTTDSNQTVFTMWKSSDTSSGFATVSVGDNATGFLTNELITLSVNTDTTESFRWGYTTSNRNELFDGNWHHVAACYVYNGGPSAQFWLDGQSKTATDGGAGAAKWNSSGIDSARIGASGTTFITANIDDFRFYKRRLRTVDVNALYNLGRTGYPGLLNRVQRVYLLPLVSSSQTVTPGVATVTLTAIALAASASGSATGTPGVATVTLSETAPAVTGSGTGTATPGAATVTLTSANLTTQGTGTATVVPGTATVSLTAIDLQVSSGGTIVAIPGVATVTVTATGLTPGAFGPVSVTPGVATVTVGAVNVTGSATGAASAIPGVAAITVGAINVSGLGTGAATVTPGTALVTITAITISAGPASGFVPPITDFILEFTFTTNFTVEFKQVIDFTLRM